MNVNVVASICLLYFAVLNGSIVPTCAWTLPSQIQTPSFRTSHRQMTDTVSTVATDLHRDPSTDEWTYGRFTDSFLAGLHSEFTKTVSAGIVFFSVLATPITIQQVDSQPSYHQNAVVPIPTWTIVQSQARALTEQQFLVDDVWKEVNRQFVDQTFNGLGQDVWKAKRLDAVKKVSNIGPDDKEKTYSVIRNMLEALGDPYTRFLTPTQFDSLTAYAKGTSTGGIGVQLMGDPTTGKVLVLNTIPGGPAAQAGILPGDVVEEVDGADMSGATAELVAAKCRGEPGSFVNVAIRHGGDGKPAANVVQLSVTRSLIQSKSVEATIIPMKEQKIGLIKISSFNQETVNKVMAALDEVRPKSNAIVLDLRGNAGGYMPAGVDVAKLFLPPRARIISEVDKAGRSTIYINDGVGSDTETPLFVLVDKRTASASEILTAALQDNRRATIVGPTKTFGKGRIQNVQPVGDGSGVAVTKAKYMTPNGNDIHGIGITPDKQQDNCESKDPVKLCLNGIFES